MNELKRAEYAAVHGGLLLIHQMLGEVRSELDKLTSVRKSSTPSIERAEVVPTYTATKQVDLGQGQTRTFTVTYSINPDGTMQVEHISIHDDEPLT